MSSNTIQNFETDVTKIIHRRPYATISISRPELSQAGKAVLITGGATGIGLAIARAFIKAGAQRTIIVGRRQKVLNIAGSELRLLAKQAAATSENGVKQEVQVLTETCDQSKPDDVRSLWAKLSSLEIDVDVLILNAADFSHEKTLLELGADELWSTYETNVKGPLYMVDSFAKQAVESPKVIINVSTQAIHMLYPDQLAMSAVRPAYGLTKNAGTMLLQQIAKDVTPEKLQVISFHPGLLYSDTFARFGVTKDSLPFDDDELPASFAVWATTAEAAFLHGRFVWAGWDIDEYSKGEVRKRIEEDEDYLKIGVIGLKGGFKA